MIDPAPRQAVAVESLDRRLLFTAVAFADPLTAALPPAGTDLVAGRFGVPGATVAAAVAVRSGSAVTVYRAEDGNAPANVGVVDFPAGQTP